MRQITTEHLTKLLADHPPQCISMYQPTHRNHPENQQDPIRYRNLLVVADSFHTKPLLRGLQSADRYQILALNRHEAKLYECNRYSSDPVELPDIRSTITEALGEELTEQHMTVASYGACAARAAGGGATPLVHAHGDKEEVDIDRDRFFRSIDRGILEHHSRPSGLPLMLAKLTGYHAPFHKVSKGDVVVVPSDWIPSATGVEAIYRF